MAGDGAPDQPAAGLEMGQGGREEGGGTVDVFEDFEEGYYVVFLFLCRGGVQVFDRAVSIGESWTGEGWVVAGVGFRNRDDRGGGVDCYYVCGVWEAGGRGGEDAAAAAYVEVGVFLVRLCGGGWGVEAGSDKVMAEGVH